MSLEHAMNNENFDRSVVGKIINNISRIVKAISPIAPHYGTTENIMFHGGRR